MCLTTAKRLAWTGQSNVGGTGGGQQFGAMPICSLSYMDGPGGSSIDEDAPGADVPHYWREDGAGPPLLAAWLAAAPTMPVNVWIHGEVWRNNPVTDYAAQVARLITKVDQLSGRSDTPWVIWLIHPLSLTGGGSTAFNATLRSYQSTVVSTLGSRGLAIDPLDYFATAPGLDGTHYLTSERTTLRNATLAAIATHLGDSTWNP